MTLPRRAQAVIALAVVGGGAALFLTVQEMTGASAPSARAIVITAVFAALVLLSWVRPLIVYVEDKSKSMHLDEGLLVALLILVGANLTFVTFAIASALALVITKRPLLKSAFNTGQLLIAVTAASRVFGLLDNGRTKPSIVEIVACLLAAVTFLIVNCAAVASILAATGVAWRAALLDGLDVRLLLDGAGVVVAVPCALLIAAFPWSLPFGVVSLLVLREVLAGHFQARHDRTRLDGLFHAALRIHQSVGVDEVRADILSSARSLLRCAQAELGERHEVGGLLSAKMLVRDRDLWLSVSKRSLTEPFDAADQSLLETLAAVGTGALSNADLYEMTRRERERLADITSSLGEGVCAIDAHGRITFMNPTAMAMLEGKGLPESIHSVVLLEAQSAPLIPEFALEPALRVIAAKKSISYDTQFERTNGGMIDLACTITPVLEDNDSTGAVLVFRDITERKRLEEDLARHAFHDTLTGLPNRRLFLDHLDHALQRAERSGERHALLFGDIDRFKVINDSLGHAAGDSLLIGIVNRINDTLRPGDMLARFGGDEFTLLLEGVEGEPDAIGAAQRIFDRLRDPIELPDGRQVVATVSIGIALTTPSKSRDDLLHDADVAMYQAKAKGRSGRYQVFDVDAMGARSAYRVDLEVGLRSALTHGELEVYYQPIFSILSGELTGAEALVRWNHPDRGLLLPNEFISLAEETGLILPLGRAVLSEVCDKVKSWQSVSGDHFSVAVNLSARQFQDAGLLEDVEAILQSKDVEPAKLCFEITESLAMDNPSQTEEVLWKLKGFGARVAIDDFGTGYSSLGYLARFPIDVVKIDQSFINGIELDAVKTAIVSAVLTMSQAVGATTVVEGVESRAQLEHLRFLGCHSAQGFYFGKPMTSKAFRELLAATSIPNVALSA